MYTAAHSFCPTLHNPRDRGDFSVTKALKTIALEPLIKINKINSSYNITYTNVNKLCKPACLENDTYIHP